MKSVRRVLQLMFLIVLPTAARAEWPARVFAPYVYLGAGDHFKLIDCDDACGQKYFTIAFVIADKQKNPAWDGRTTMEKNLYGDQIVAIRARGGDVIVSFGGEGGSELARVEEDAAALEAKYESVITRYQFTWLDFDIEGKATADTAANERRNTALAKLQTRHPGLRISYTLPVDPNGIPKGSLKLLSDAKAKGVVVYSANVMTMDFGSHFAKDKKMSDVSIASAIKAHEQCQAIDEKIRIGITPMVGQNDEKSEIFTLEDARALREWATSQPWVCSISFWSSNRDVKSTGGKKSGNTGSGIEQQAWDFTNVFRSFAAGPNAAK